MNFSWLVPDRKTRRNLIMLLTLLLAATVQAANTWYVDANLGKNAGSGLTRDGAKQSIQEAIDAAAEGDEILVNDGTYEPFDVANKAITIRSVNGPEKTIIDGGNAKRCATLGDSTDLEERKATLEGFTLQNGCAGEKEKWPGQGSGAFGGMLTNCILTRNISPSHDSMGLSMAAYGGGAFNCLLTNCTLTENQAKVGGGAHSSTLNNCKLIGNTATGQGGGMVNGLLTNCILVGNTAQEGGGIYMGGLANCTVIGNTATETGGGAVLCGVIANSIVWGNIAPENANYSESNVDYSCTEPLPEEGEENISTDPMFTDAENGDYTLKKGSPCIDSGSNEIVEMLKLETDLAGNPRIMDKVVDMGAFESAGTPLPPKIEYTWQSGWNTIYLPFSSLDPDTIEALAKMPVFKLSANTNVKDQPVSCHTPLWVFCADPENAPDLRGTMPSDTPENPLETIPVGRWTLIGVQSKIETLPNGYVAWEWRDGRYTCVQSLQTGQFYFIYRSNTP